MLKLNRSRVLSWAFGLVAAAALGAVVITFVRVWIPGYGITRMIPIGREFNRRGIAAYRATPKYMDPYPPDRWGFDGQYYAEIALDPLLRDPQLKTAIDNPPYRADRILLPWLAWIGGLGQPYWVLNVYAALNGIFWLGYLVILWRLFRPLGWPGLGGFAALLLTCGVVESMYRTLTDFPAFVLLTLAALAGGASSGALLGLSALTREVNILALPALFGYSPPWGRTVRRNVIVGLLAGVPLVLWYAYVRWRLPVASSLAGDNFDWPLHAILERVREAAAAARRGELVWTEFYRRGTEAHAMLTVVAVLAQCLYVATHPQWKDRLWRVAALFIPFFLCISSNVWASYSYFTVTRHALPITLAFNLALARRPGRWWLAWFVLGNCFVPAAVVDFWRFGQANPRRIEASIEAPPPYDAQIAVRYETGWSGPEGSGRKNWRWAISPKAELVLANASRDPLVVQLSFTALSLVPRDLRVEANGKPIWVGRLGQKLQPASVRTQRFALPPGETRVRFATPQAAGPPIGDDPRPLVEMVSNLLVSATPVR